ncbi:hypothetical protein glysoja_046071, partial [Glycine soja]
KCITRTTFDLCCFLSLAVNPDMCQIKYRLPAMVVTQVQLDRAKVSTKSAVLMNLESKDIRRELEMEIIEEHTVMEYSKVNKKCEKCGHGEATYYTRLVSLMYICQFNLKLLFNSLNLFILIILISDEISRQRANYDKGQTTFYACTGCGHPSQEN